jgi:hypothetical protein
MIHLINKQYLLLKKVEARKADHEREITRLTEVCVTRF